MDNRWLMNGLSWLVMVNCPFSNGESIHDENDYSIPSDLVSIK